MKRIIENEVFSQERALYNSKDVRVLNCKFEGEADGESPLKESNNIEVEGCEFSLRYPFWHITDAKVIRTKMNITCRAPLWYAKNVEFEDCILNAPKNLRESDHVSFINTNIVSPEFGWKCNDIYLKNSSLEGEYAFLDSSNVTFYNVRFKGKYSFQYVKNVKIKFSDIDTKDAFWHVENGLIENCTIKGEYIGWYSNHLTFRNCTIEGTQPFCYCNNLVLENCTMKNCDLAFERSTVQATLHGKVDSIKNPISGHIIVDEVGEIIELSEEAQKNNIIEIRCNQD